MTVTNVQHGTGRWIRLDRTSERRYLICKGMSGPVSGALPVELPDGASGGMRAFLADASGNGVSKEIRVILADCARLVRAGLRALLEPATDIAVVGEAASGEEALRLAHQTGADVIMIDRSLVTGDGLAALRRVQASRGLSHVKVLILGAGDDDVLDSLHANASGMLLNETDPGELLRAVRGVARPGAQLTPPVARRLTPPVARRMTNVLSPLPGPEDPALDRFADLTARERDVLALVAEGLTNQEIGQRLVVSAATAKTHVSRSMLKLGVHQRAKLVALAYQTGFVGGLRLSDGRLADSLGDDGFEAW